MASPAVARSPAVSHFQSSLAPKSPLGRLQSRSGFASGHDEFLYLLLEREASSAASATQVLQTIRLLPSTTVRDVKMVLARRGVCTTDSSLVFGNRELLEHEMVGKLVHEAEAGPEGFLHVFVKLSDVQAVEVTAELPTAPEGQDHDEEGVHQISSPAKSALTMSLADPQTPAKNRFEPFALSPGFALAKQDPAATKLIARPTRNDNLNDTAIVHLVVRRDSKVSWRTIDNDQYELSISTADTAESVKRKLQLASGVPAEAANWQLHFNGQIVPPSKPLVEYGVQPGSTLELVPLYPAPVYTPRCSLPNLSPPLSSPEHALFSDFMKARAGLAKGLRPRLAASGTGGSYFICGEDGQNVAIFKPEDEEPLAVNNPKGHGRSLAGDALRHGVNPGEGAAREVAAFLLDHDHFAGVPPTAMVSCKPQASMDGAGIAKVGSLQQYVHADADCEEQGNSAFPVEQIHKIVQLDVRLGNADRNGGNILARRKNGSWELIPIDHGYCLPSSFRDFSWEWVWWPQARVPFSPATKQYIAQLDADKDLAKLAAQGIALRPECHRVLKVNTMLLQKAAARNLTPQQIGEMCCRLDEDAESPLEMLHAKAVELAQAGDCGPVAGPICVNPDRLVSQDLYLEHMADLVDGYLDEVVLEHADSL